MKFLTNLTGKTIKAAMLLLLFSCFYSSNIFALSMPSAAAGPPCGGPFGPCLPIDGGISFLLAAGALFGGKKAYDAYKAKRIVK